MLATLAVPAVFAANTAELTTGNIRSGASIDNLKASWGKALSLGKFNADVTATYDYSNSKDSLDEVTISGDLIEGSGDDLSVGYEVTRNFASGDDAIKFTATSGGTDIVVDYSKGEVTEISATRDLDVGDYKVTAEPSWVVKAKSARVKLMSSLGSDKDSFSADVEVTDGDARITELGMTHALEDDKSVSATLNPESKDLEIEYTDPSFEDGATWKAVINTKAEGNMIDEATVSLSRSWSW